MARLDPVYAPTLRRPGAALAAIVLFLCFLCAAGPGLDAQLNQGLVLANGSSSHVAVPHAAPLAPASGLTVEAWLTYDGSTLGTGYRWPTVVRKDVRPGRESYILRVGASNTQNTNLEWHVVTTSGRCLTTWRFQVGQLNTWTHVACTWDGAVSRIFVNGAEVANQPCTGTLLDSGGALQIGEGDAATPGAETWNGRLDEIRVWPRARTAGEIASTMNLELTSVPGEVTTWNLNGDGTDSSGTNHGTASQPGLFSGLALTLASVDLSGSRSFGAGTAGCLGTPLAGVSSTPDIGNSDFAFTCVRATATGGGVFGLATARLPGPATILGANLWILPNEVTLAIPGGTLGSVRTPFPIPNLRGLVGQTIYAQYFWLDPTCQPTAFSSDGLQVTVLP